MDWKFCTQLTHKYNNWSVVSANCLEMKLTWNFQLLSSDILRLNSNSLLLHFSCTIFCEDEWHFRESNATETGCEVILEWKSQRLNAIAVWCSPWPFAFELIALSMGLFPGYFIFFIHGFLRKIRPPHAATCFLIFSPLPHWYMVPLIPYMWGPHGVNVTLIVGLIFCGCLWCLCVRTDWTFNHSHSHFLFLFWFGIAIHI